MVLVAPLLVVLPDGLVLASRPEVLVGTPVQPIARGFFGHHVDCGSGLPSCPSSTPARAVAAERRRLPDEPRRALRGRSHCRRGARAERRRRHEVAAIETAHRRRLRRAGPASFESRVGVAGFPGARRTACTRGARLRPRATAAPLAGATAPDDHLGWGWASNPADARAFVEPTARALTAVKALAPENASARSEAVRVLTRLQCADGGWNYGTASVNAVDLRGYAQTTAIALVGLQGESSALGRVRAAFPAAVRSRSSPAGSPRRSRSSHSASTATATPRELPPTPSRRSHGGARSSTVRSQSRGRCSPPGRTR